MLNGPPPDTGGSGTATVNVSAFCEIATGVPLFDAENCELGSLAKRLWEESRSGTNAAYLRGRFDTLNKKFRSHFAHEEDYMLHSGFPDHRRHSDDHARLSGLLDQLISRLDDCGAGEPAFLSPMTYFFIDVLPVHVTWYDCPWGTT